MLIQSNLDEVVKKQSDVLFKEGDIIEVRVLAARGSGKTPKSRCFEKKELPEKLINWIEDQKLDQYPWMPCWGINPRKDKNGRKDSDVKLSRTLAADFDNEDFPREDLSNEEKIYYVRQHIQDQELPCPTMLNFSGNGVHACWRLSEDITDLDIWKKAIKGLSIKLGSCRGIAKLSQPLRIVGIPNFKDKDQPKETWIIEADPQRIYDFEEFEDCVSIADKKKAETAKKKKKKKRKKKKIRTTCSDAFNLTVGGTVKLYNTETEESIEVRIEDTEGDDLLALCPWHNDNNPSLKIDKDEGCFHCFVCDAKGRIDSEGYYAVPDSKSKNQTAKLIELASKDIIQLFKDRMQVRYVTYKDGQQTKTCRVDSQELYEWLWYIFHQNTGNTINSNKIKDIVTFFKYKAGKGETRDVYTRIADYEDKIYVNLANEKGEVVEISKYGWKIINNPPVCFLAAPAMQPLVKPQESSKGWNYLRKYMNLSQRDFNLLSAFVIGCYSPNIEFPILNIHGQHGTAKSTMMKFIKYIVDPCRPMLVTPPENEEDLLVTASHIFLLAYDNASTISYKMSDAFSRLATGTGFQKRSLYTDGGLFAVSCKRPVIINGIPMVVNREDMMSRSILLESLPINSADRKPSGEIEKEFLNDLPCILASIFDAVSSALRNYQTVVIPELPRMASFAKWVVSAAAEGTMPFSKDQFLSEYSNNQAESSRQLLSEDTVVQALTKFIEFDNCTYWEGSTTELYNLIKPENAEFHSDWPNNSKAFGKRLNRIKPDLQLFGISLESIRTRSGTVWNIRKTAEVSDNTDNFPSFGT